MVKEEFEKTYEDTYEQLLKFVIIKCYNISDIDDIIQDTYIELYKVMKRKKKIDNIHTFILGIASNVIKRHYYKRNKLNVISEEVGTLDSISDSFDLEESVINSDNAEKIWNYVKTKDITTIKIFYLYYRLDEKISDIAKELDVSESFVKNKLYRTLNEIKILIEKEDF